MQFRLRPFAVLAALLTLGYSALVFSDDGIHQPFLNITAPNQIDGLSVNPNTAGPGNFSTLSTSGLSNIGGPLQLNGVDAPVTPGGRLTPSSTLPVPIADVSSSGVTTVYYLPYIGQLAPIYNGTHWTAQNITASGLSVTSNGTNVPVNQTFDVYLSMQSGSPVLCTMYWGGGTRSASVGGFTGAANATITTLNGIYVNAAAIATGNCFNNTTSYAIGINQGTLLGSFYTSAGGATYNYTCHAAGASGGNFAAITLSNVYNKVTQSCTNIDTATAVTSSSASWALLSSGDTFSWVDSVQTSNISYSAHIVAGNGTAAGDCGSFGVTIAVSATAPNTIATTCAPTGTLGDNYNTLAVNESFYPRLGRSQLKAVIQSATGTTTYMPTSTQEELTVTIQW